MTATGISIAGPPTTRAAEILSPEALAFVGLLQREFEPRRRELLAARAERWERLKTGELPDFLDETREVRLALERAHRSLQHLGQPLRVGRGARDVHAQAEDAPE